MLYNKIRIKQVTKHMLVIRLRRQGKKHHPSYRLVVAERSFPVKGKYLEKLGFFSPLTKELQFDKDKILSFLNVGAQPSNTVSRLLIKAGLKHKLLVFTPHKPKPAKEKKEKKEKRAAAVQSADKEESVSQEESKEEGADKSLEETSPGAKVESPPEDIRQLAE
ncbi:MAG: small subunit ribosomal protein S16 [Candidatus Berkelbacteria bacterium Licking1014_2]|uniref:Small ribosomal subunit protein bS16 n=1 Tax=Candidatus Berkelbacteria bacterium Licking1014_2 TaxID=2017146 RepID=A0A554LUS3_9BACT|nr:MAG: small subunit ribosomal protein S16 [Candidatus Berkelbacteria bacterium Licking1014_2]